MITLTQPGLIEQVITDVGMDKYSKERDKTADAILHPDPTGVSRQEKWNYRSIIGKLNHIANNTRPDISMAIHQCKALYE